MLQNSKREKSKELTRLQSETQSIASLQEKRIELSKKQEKVKSEVKPAQEISTNLFNTFNETKKDFEDKEAQV